jgi:hypothetical protein
MSFAVLSSLNPHTRSTVLEESIMTASYTFDVFSSLDGFGSYSGGDWGGYWGKQGPELPTTASPCTARSSVWSSGPTRIGRSRGC